ncbi:hypothetical protein [Phaeocystidibacter luteus]|uniref:DUF4760 domain-containing protein n=1 Tax=Phaeocystidibacter luteus TaxID=911197 RepID=A0A6N6RG08_9FLAO|nr:hypothetical protein [Phaeocystidibacter luteus]KAB2810009.1 hypothetical protein F8C67_09010 [Phaeocystidibacter luteus]
MIKLVRTYKWALLFSICLSISIYTYIHYSYDSNIFLASIGGLATLYLGLIRYQLEYDRLFQELFTAFNTRYDKLNDDILDIRKRSESLKERDTKIIIDYFNLCAEEYLWYSRGRIPKSVWKAWKSGIDENLNTPIIKDLFILETKSINSASSYYGLRKELNI